MRIRYLLVAGVMLVGAAAWAQDEQRSVMRLQVPRGTQLSAAEQELVNQANACLARAYQLLAEQHEPGLAVSEMRKAMAIQERIGGIAVGTQSAGRMPDSDVPGTPADQVDVLNRLALLVEIQHQGHQGAPAAVESELHRRRLLQAKREEIGRLADEQQRINDHSRNSGGAGGGPIDPKAADNQQKVADGLRTAAADLAKAGAASPAHDLTQAADHANGAADAQRRGNGEQSRQQGEATSDAINQALRGLGTDRGGLAEALAAIEQQLGQMIDRQAALRQQTQKLSAAVVGADERRTRSITLALGEGELKTQIESVIATLGRLAESLGGRDVSAAEGIVHTKLLAAVRAMESGRARQSAIDATVKLTGSDLPAAERAMGAVVATLTEARQHVAAAEAAATGGKAGRLRLALSKVQDLRRDAEVVEQLAGSPGQGGSGNPSPAAQKLRDGIAARAADLPHELKQLLPPEEQGNLPALFAGPATQPADVPLAARPRGIVSVLTPIEQELKHRLDQVVEEQAMRSFRGEAVPTVYQAAVAAYFEGLAREGGK